MARSATLRDGAQPARTRQCAEDRRRSILAAAQKVFLERGYANASIDAVVELAGGSKATVYQQFGNKEGLLGALVTEGADELAHLVQDLPLDGALEESLRAFGRGYLNLIMRPERLALFPPDHRRIRTGPGNRRRLLSHRTANGRQIHDRVLPQGRRGRADRDQRPGTHRPSIHPGCAAISICRTC